MKQPPGFTSTTHPTSVCRLLRSLYGLKQSPRAWYEDLDTFLRTIGCTRSQLDPNLYFLFQGTATAIIFLFVDDLLLTGGSPKLTSALKHHLQVKYCMKDLGPVKRYLGIDFLHTDHGILLHQQRYTLALAHHYDLADCKTVSSGRSRPLLQHRFSIC